MALLEVTDETAASVLTSNRLVVLDFWADWCMPCRPVLKRLEDLAAQFGDKVVFGKVNTEENARLVAEYGIRSLPTVIFFKDGKPFDQRVGASGVAALEETIKQHV